MSNDSKRDTFIANALTHAASSLDTVAVQHATHERCNTTDVAMRASAACRQHADQHREAAAAAASTHDGPARVASDAYRAGWDTLFGARVEKGVS